MSAQLNDLLETMNQFVWGTPLILLILIGSLLLSLRLRFFQLRRLPLAFRYIRENESEGDGEVSSLGALCTSLSATIGTGNIVGVATAVTAGGPGALFWMELAALLGMATKYAEGFLAVKYRVTYGDGHVLGGPFCYIEYGMGARWRWLAKLFAFFGVCAGLFGIGTVTQANGISTAVRNFFDPDSSHTVTTPAGEYPISAVIVSIVLTCAAALILMGGIRRIAKVSEFVVPGMAVLYITASAALLAFHLTELPSAVSLIVTSAFHPQAVTGGLIASALIPIQKGVARGIFSNEAGLGSAPIAAAAVKSHDPVRQGLISMTGTFIDTILLCTMTGLSIVLTGAWDTADLSGVQVTAQAFHLGLPLPASASSFLLMVCLIFFAFTTILGWNYYSERCLEYLSGQNRWVLRLYRLLYLSAIFIGPYLTVGAVWTAADILNGLMAVPNMIAIFALSGIVVRESRSL